MKKIDVKLMRALVEKFVEVNLYPDSIFCNYKTVDEVYDSVMRTLWLGTDLTTVYEWYDTINVQGIKYVGKGVFTSWVNAEGYHVDDIDDIPEVVEKLTQDVLDTIENCSYMNT